MHKGEAFLSNVVHLAAPLHRVRENILAVKLHPDAVSVLQLEPKLRDWRLERIVTWSLGKDIGRHLIQANHTHLVGQIHQLREAARIHGVDAGISIPAGLFDTRLLTVPFIPAEELAEEAEIEGFWEEQDPELTRLNGKIIRYQIIYASENDDKTVILFSSIPELTVRRYINLLLDADLLPIYIENEAFSLINGVFTRLEAEKADAPVMILHICPSVNQMIGFAPDKVVMQKVPVSEFDEALLLELEDIDSIEGEFWTEVAIRISEQIKQTIAFLREEMDFPATSKVYLVSEHKNIANMMTLLQPHMGHIRLAAWDALAGVDIPADNARYVDYFGNSSVFTTALGLATQAINVSGMPSDERHRRLIDLNFLPAAGKIRRTRRFAIVNKLLVAAIGFMFCVPPLLIALMDGPDFFASREGIAAYDKIAAKAQAENIRRVGLEKKVSELTETNQKLNKLVTPRSYVTFMQSLADILPPEAELETLTISDEAQVMITGFAQTTVAINDFANNLVEQGLVRKAPVKQNRAGNLYAFTIDTTLIKWD